MEVREVMHQNVYLRYLHMSYMEDREVMHQNVYLRCLHMSYMEVREVGASECIPEMSSYVLHGS